MKSYRNLYPQIITWYNLHEAWRKARKGKRGKVPAAGPVAQFCKLRGQSASCGQYTIGPPPAVTRSTNTLNSV